MLLCDLLYMLQAVSSGAYSLSALLLTAAFHPALAVGEFNPGAGASVTASQPPSIPNPTAPGGLTAFEGLLIFAPVILYGLFSVYRSKVNERAKVLRFESLLCSMNTYRVQAHQLVHGNSN